MNLEQQTQIDSENLNKPQQNTLTKHKRNLIKKNQIIIYFLTFLAYLLIHSTRTVWSASKQHIKDEFPDVDAHFLGIVDSCFLLSYAISMNCLSSHLRRAKVQFIFGAGIISMSIWVLLIFVVCYFSLSRFFLILFMLLNGISQSIGWPCAVQSMGNWYCKSHKGLLMGLWSTCGNFGNIAGFLIADFAVNILEQKWTFSILQIGLLNLSVGLFILTNMESYPQDIGISVNDLAMFHSQTEQPQNEEENNLLQPSDAPAITLRNAWMKVPQLAVYSIVIGGLKGTIYGKLFWLPIFLSQKGIKRQASLICSMSEIGTLIGGLLLGYLVDKLKLQTLLIMVFMAMSTLAMLILHIMQYSDNILSYYVLVLIAGIGLGGPFSLIGGAVAIEIASQKEVIHQKNIIGMVAGMLEGFGSFVAAVVQFVVPYFGLSNMFILFSIISGLSCMFLVSNTIKEIKSLFR